MDKMDDNIGSVKLPAKWGFITGSGIRSKFMGRVIRTENWGNNILENLMLWYVSR
jgi:hypothetical protein